MASFAGEVLLGKRRRFDVKHSMTKTAVAILTGAARNRTMATAPPVGVERIGGHFETMDEANCKERSSFCEEGCTQVCQPRYVFRIVLLIVLRGWINLGGARMLWYVEAPGQS